MSSPQAQPDDFVVINEGDVGKYKDKRYYGPYRDEHGPTVRVRIHREGVMYAIGATDAEAELNRKAALEMKHMTPRGKSVTGKPSAGKKLPKKKIERLLSEYADVKARLSNLKMVASANLDMLDLEVKALNKIKESADDSSSDDEQ